MKRTFVFLMVVALVAGSVATAQAGKKKAKKPAPPYTQEVTYTQPAVGTAGAGVTFESLQFPTNSTHVFMSVEIADDNSPTAYGDFSWDTDGNGINDTGITVCGATDEPVEVPANTTINAFMWLLPSPFCAGFSTSGTIKATFSATP